jgi:hypothetical protein
MGFRGVWLTPCAAVNRRVLAGMGRDLQKGPAENSLSQCRLMANCRCPL